MQCDSVKAEDKRLSALSHLLDEITKQRDRATRAEKRVAELEAMIVSTHEQVFDKGIAVAPTK
jgi:hypothetical protein